MLKVYSFYSKGWDTSYLLLSLEERAQERCEFGMGALLLHDPFYRMIGKDIADNCED
jgi:hypothetical protein